MVPLLKYAGESARSGAEINWVMCRPPKGVGGHTTRLRQHVALPKGRRDVGPDLCKVLKCHNARMQAGTAPVETALDRARVLERVLGKSEGSRQKARNRNSLGGYGVFGQRVRF